MSSQRRNWATDELPGETAKRQAAAQQAAVAPQPFAALGIGHALVKAARDKNRRRQRPVVLSHPQLRSRA